MAQSAPTLPDAPNDPLGTRPIGIFDSGVGGLTVAAALRQALPDEPLVYLGDTARLPWGTRSGEVVRRYAKDCSAFLMAKRAKMVVVACNTASAYALADLQAALPVPVLGVIEAGASIAAQHSPHGNVGVLATPGTVTSQAYQKALARLAPKAQVMAVPCPLFVPLAEEGLTDHPATRLIAQDYLRALIAWPAQAVVLGCTHYPILTPLLAVLLGPDVRLIDSATAVAQATQRALREANLAHPEGPGPGALEVYATDVTPRLRRVAATFLGAEVAIEAVQLP